jgi:hypothetical protein
MGYGRKVWCVSFDQVAIGGHHGCDFADFLGIPEGDDARK